MKYIGLNWTLALKFSIGKKKRMRDCRILMAHDCIYCTVGVAKIFDLLAHFLGASLHIVEHFYKVSAKNNDRYPYLNTVLCLPLNDSTSILCSNT